MERHDLNDDLDRRLRASRPAAASVDEHAFDGALLARVRQQPVAPRRALPRSISIPAAAGAIVVATAAVVLGGGPDNVGGPPSAAAITQQTLQWFDPPTGSIVHVRSVETTGTETSTRESWQSVDDPTAERELVEGPTVYETSSDAIYDPARNTIYDGFASSGDAGATAPKPFDPAKAASQEPPVGGKGTAIVGDPIVAKVRTLLGAGRMTVSGHELHDGVDSWAISLGADSGRPVWTLWVSAADGKPLELVDPGRDASEQPQDIRWPVYEVLRGDSATEPLLTLAGAHPSARVVDDPAQAEAAAQRLLPPKS